MVFVVLFFSLEFESHGCGEVSGFKKENLEFSVIKFGALAVPLWLTSMPPCIPLPFHAPLGLQAPMTSTALQETARWHPEGAGAPRRRS